MHVIASGHVTLSHLTCFRHIILQLESDQNDMMNSNAGFCSYVRRGLGEDKNKQLFCFVLSCKKSTRKMQGTHIVGDAPKEKVVLSSIKGIIGPFMGKHTEFGEYISMLLTKFGRCVRFFATHLCTDCSKTDLYCKVECQKNRKASYKYSSLIV